MQTQTSNENSELPSMGNKASSFIVKNEDLEESAIEAINSLPKEHSVPVMARYQEDSTFKSMIQAAVLYMAARVTMARTVRCEDVEFEFYIRRQVPSFAHDFDANLIMTALIDETIDDVQTNPDLSDEELLIMVPRKSYVNRLNAIKSLFNY